MTSGVPSSPESGQPYITLLITTESCILHSVMGLTRLLAVQNSTDRAVPPLKEFISLCMQHPAHMKKSTSCFSSSVKFLYAALLKCKQTLRNVAMLRSSFSFSSTPIELESMLPGLASVEGWELGWTVLIQMNHTAQQVSFERTKSFDY
ncbi:hypothetical protein LshimejAT787_1001380 [Lyophyllum shimeji]|uniref:Uncharacterized protein n=1 Tax=Lyophyllum shimeji TaxID=47721 RepID=A0A9P3PTZ0_LYOSH|nr:hypothetical protein LshimejAT787_1001380 [Lyophyllum shimeji]